MNRLILGFVVILFSYICLADTADIIGFVYYQNYDQDYTYYFANDSTDGVETYPIHEATVKLYKRNSSSEWEVFSSSILTDSGFFCFNDVDLSRDSSALCTSSNWFMVEFDASEQGCLPPRWAYQDTLYRFSHNEVRPAGVPDAGSIRVDCIFEGSDWVVYNGSSLQIDKLTGHWMSEDSGGITFSLEQGSGKATCPIDSIQVDVGSCMIGHWSNTECLDDWDDASGYSYYFFYPKNGTQADALGWYYTVWSNAWPNYGFHQDESMPSSVFIVNDFAFIED